jgi:hypothetical protein
LIDATMTTHHSLEFLLWSSYCPINDNCELSSDENQHLQLFINIVDNLSIFDFNNNFSGNLSSNRELNLLPQTNYTKYLLSIYSSQLSTIPSFHSNLSSNTHLPALLISHLLYKPHMQTITVSPHHPFGCLGPLLGPYLTETHLNLLISTLESITIRFPSLSSATITATIPTITPPNNQQTKSLSSPTSPGPIFNPIETLPMVKHINTPYITLIGIYLACVDQTKFQFLLLNIFNVFFSTIIPTHEIDFSGLNNSLESNPEQFPSIQFKNIKFPKQHAQTVTMLRSRSISNLTTPFYVISLSTLYTLAKFLSFAPHKSINTRKSTQIGPNSSQFNSNSSLSGSSALKLNPDPSLNGPKSIPTEQIPPFVSSSEFFYHFLQHFITPVIVIFIQSYPTGRQGTNVDDYLISLMHIFSNYKPNNDNIKINNGVPNNSPLSSPSPSYDLKIDNSTAPSLATNTPLSPSSSSFTHTILTTISHRILSLQDRLDRESGSNALATSSMLNSKNGLTSLFMKLVGETIKLDGNYFRKNCVLNLMLGGGDGGKSMKIEEFFEKNNYDKLIAFLELFC